MYTAKDLAIIIPTKDRPEQVKRHLLSLAEQNCEIGRIILIASGKDVLDIIFAFKGKLNIDYFRSNPGQIKQRNIGISKLDNTTKLVATMDDDATYHKNSINNMIEFWNNSKPGIGGVGFNIINLPSNNHNWFRGLLGFSSKKNGKVFKSGFCTTIANVGKNVQVEWLNGGATVWLQELLKNNHHKEININWAVGEDIIFSYPLGKRYSFYICSTAKVEIEEVIINKEPKEFYINRGISLYLMGLYFIQCNKNLSLTHFLINKFIYIISLFFKSIIFRQKSKYFLAIGIIKAFYMNNNALFRLKKINLFNTKNTYMLK